jgi:hypothetical protein
MVLHIGRGGKVNMLYIAVLRGDNPGSAEPIFVSRDQTLLNAIRREMARTLRGTNPDYSREKEREITNRDSHK